MARAAFAGSGRRTHSQCYLTPMKAVFHYSLPVLPLSLLQAFLAASVVVQGAWQSGVRTQSVGSLISAVAANAYVSSYPADGTVHRGRLYLVKQVLVPACQLNGSCVHHG